MRRRSRCRIALFFLFFLFAKCVQCSCRRQLGGRDRRIHRRAVHVAGRTGRGKQRLPSYPATRPWPTLSVGLLVVLTLHRVAVALAINLPDHAPLSLVSPADRPRQPVHSHQLPYLVGQPPTHAAARSALSPAGATRPRGWRCRSRRGQRDFVQVSRSSAPIYPPRIMRDGVFCDDGAESIQQPHLHPRHASSIGRPARGHGACCTDVSAPTPAALIPLHHPLPRDASPAGITCFTSGFRRRKSSIPRTRGHNTRTDTNDTRMLPTPSSRVILSCQLPT